MVFHTVDDPIKFFFFVVSLKSTTILDIKNTGLYDITAVSAVLTSMFLNIMMQKNKM